MSSTKRITAHLVGHMTVKEIIRSCIIDLFLYQLHLHYSPMLISHLIENIISMELCVSVCNAQTKFTVNQCSVAQNMNNLSGENGHME